MTSEMDTPRLLLRPLTEADVEHLLRLDSDPAVMRYLNGGIPTPQAIIEQVTLPRMLQATASGAGAGGWAIEERATGAFLGWVSLRVTTEPGTLELGYRLRQAAWGHGFATEAACAVMGRAFREHTTQRIIATTYQENIGSRRVMEKAGMSLIRTFHMTADELEVEADTFAVSGEVWEGDDVEYEARRETWLRQDGRCAEGGAL